MENLIAAWQQNKPGVRYALMLSIIVLAIPVIWLVIDPAVDRLFIVQMALWALSMFALVFAFAEPDQSSKKALQLRILQYCFSIAALVSWFFLSGSWFMQILIAIMMLSIIGAAISYCYQWRSLQQGKQEGRPQ